MSPAGWCTPAVTALDAQVEACLALAFLPGLTVALWPLPHNEEHTERVMWSLGCLERLEQRRTEPTPKKRCSGGSAWIDLQLSENCLEPLVFNVTAPPVRDLTSPACRKLTRAHRTKRTRTGRGVRGSVPITCVYPRGIFPFMPTTLSPGRTPAACAAPPEAHISRGAMSERCAANAISSEPYSFPGA